MPPRKPEPSETTEAAALSVKMSAITWSGRSIIPVRCSAPCPDDITCGVTSAIAPTARPPSAGRSGSHSFARSSSCSHSATPRIRPTPTSAATSPRTLAITRSRPLTGAMASA